MRKAIDLIGRRFGKLTVVARSEDKEKERRQKSAFWICKCECGNTVEVHSLRLRNGDASDCGCSHSWFDDYGNSHRSSGTYKDLTGERFGRLLVIKRIGTDQNKKPLWECKCDCGNITNTNSFQLVQGHTNSCGCLRREVIRDIKTIDISGQKFGRLTALYKNYDTSKWVCLCRCGKIKEISYTSLVHGGTKSCGCIMQDLLHSWTGTNHPNWKGRNHIILFLRHSLIEWKKESMSACNYRCVISGASFDDIHHLYPVNKMVDDIYKITRFPVYKTIGEYTDEQIKKMQYLFLDMHYKHGLGVCLTRDLHYEFHHLYGQVHFTPENFYEFYRNKTGKVFDVNSLFKEVI